MYPEFHPPTFIQPSTHRPGYQHPKPEVVETHPAFHRVGPRGAWWVTLLQGTRRGDPAFRRVRTRGPAAWFSSSSSALFVVFVVVQPPPGDPVLGAKQSSSPPGPSTILPALTISCMHLNLLTLLLTFYTHLSYRCNRTLWSPPEPIPRGPTFVSATTSLGATLPHSSPHW
jgi:hypothetical protein